MQALMEEWIRQWLCNREAVGSNLPWGDFFFALAQKSLEAIFQPRGPPRTMPNILKCPQGMKTAVYSDEYSPKFAENCPRTAIFAEI